MATAKSKEKKQRRERLLAEKADTRELKTARQKKVLIVISGIVVAMVLLLSIFFCTRGILRSFREKNPPKPSVLDRLQEAPDALEGYWWHGEDSFFCIEEGKYRSYSLADDGSAYYLSSEFTAALLGDTLLLYPKDSKTPVTIRYSLEDEGKRLELQYTTPAGESFIPSFTAGDPPTLPMRGGSDQ